MGSMPPQLLEYINGADISGATKQFNDAITQIAQDFIEDFTNGAAPADIKLNSPEILGLPVRLDYVASGSVGSVYKMRIGNNVFALKINRNASAGEMGVIATQSRARNLVNKMYLGAVFKYNNRKYSWVLSDYIATDRENSFCNAMEKLYYAYLTKGLDIRDAHPNNFKDGKLIDQASLGHRDGKIDDIKKLTRVEIDIVKKLVYYIKTDNTSEFQNIITKAIKTHPGVINYMFFAMKFGKSPIFGSNKTDPFSIKVKKFESIINSAYRGRTQNNIATVRNTNDMTM